MLKDKSFLEIIEDYVDDDKVTLPPFDQTALQIQQQLQKDDVEIAKIEQLISSDPALSTQILKVANSSFFRGLSKVLTIHDAIVRLGIDEITKMVLILSQKKLYQTKDSFIKNYRHNLWLHSVVCAMTCQWAAEKAGFEKLAQEAFFAALLHDIGKLFLITIIEEIEKAQDVHLIPSKSVINELISTLHTQQGYNLLTKWNIPEKYCYVAKAHHDKKFDPKNISLILLRMVDKTCIKLGISVETTMGDISIAAESNFLGFSDIHVAELELHIEDTLNKVNTMYPVGTV